MPLESRHVPSSASPPSTQWPSVLLIALLVTGTSASDVIVLFKAREQKTKLLQKPIIDRSLYFIGQNWVAFSL